MAGPVNAKVYHEQLKSVFSSGSAAATTSPLAFMEKTSTATQQLLKEQMNANDNILKALNVQNKLLTKLLKTGTGGGGGILDTLAEAMVLKHIAKYFGGGAIVAGVAGVFKSGGALVGKSVKLLRSSVTTIFSKTTGFVTAHVSNFLREGMKVLSNVGKPFLNSISKLTALATTGGLLQKAANIGNLISKSGGLLLRGLGKLAWPITALLGLLDGISGFMAADKDLGRGGKVNLFRKIEYAKAAVVNGLLLGIPDFISKKLTGRSYGKAIDDGIMRVQNAFASYAHQFGRRFTRALSTSKSRLQDLWAKMPTSEDFKNISYEIRDVIFGLGGYIKSGFIGMVDDIKGWFKDIMSWRPWDQEMGRNLPSQDFMDAIKPRPRTTIIPPPSVGTYGRDSYYGTIYNNRERPRAMAPVQAAPQAIARSQPANSMPPMTAPSNNTSEVATNALLRMQTLTPQQLADKVPEIVKDVVTTGTAVLINMSAAMARTYAEQAKLQADKTGETAGVSMAEGVANSFTEEIKKTGLMKELLTKIPNMMKEQFDRLFNKENMSTLSDILTGSSGNADMSQLLGLPANSGSAGNIGTPDYGPEKTNANFGTPEPSSPMPNRPTWWDTTKIGPQRPMGTIGSLPPEAYETPAGGSKDVSNASTGAQLIDTMVQAGASPVYAKAAVGNFAQESGSKFNPNASGDNGSAYGIKQWRGIRRSNLMRFAAERGLNASDRRTQALFAVEESREGSPYADKGAVNARKIIDSTPGMTPEAAAETFAWKDERPSPRYAHIGNRQRQAVKYGDEYDQLMDTTTPGSAYADANSGPLSPYAVPGTADALTVKGTSFNHPDQKAGVRPELLGVLDALSAKTGRQVNVTSGYRSPAHNRRVGGSKASYHVQGKAADIDLGGMNPQQRKYVAANLIKLGVGGLITYTKSPNMLHADMRKQIDGNAHFMHDRTDKKMGNAPDWFKEVAAMSPEEISKLADSVVPGMAQAIAAQQPGSEKEPLSNNPLFSSLKNKGGPRSNKQTATSSNPLKGGNASQDAMQSSTVMQSKLKEIGFSGDSMFGASSPGATSRRVEANAAVAATERVVKPKAADAPVASGPTTGAPRLQPIKADKNVSAVNFSAPAINSIPSADELRMLAVNSEIFN